jgi:hypothetical protein
LPANVIAAAVILATLIAGCASLSERIAPPTDLVTSELHVDPLYEELHPRYMELCAVSQFSPMRSRSSLGTWQ